MLPTTPSALVCCLLTLFWPFGPALAGDAFSTGTIEVVVEGLTAENALVEVNLWQGADGWLDRDSDASRYRTSSVQGVAGTAQAVFEAVPHGDYAVTAYQDDNDNGRLDQGMFRLPKERLGFSNGLRPRFAAPAYEDAAVYLENDLLQVRIHLHRMP